MRSSRAFFGAFLITLSVAACTSPKVPAPAPGAAAVNPGQGVPTADAGPRPDSAESAVDPSSLFGKIYAVLGESCDPAKDDPRLAQEGARYCSARGEVVGLWYLADRLPEPPDTVVFLTKPKPQDVADSYVALDGDRILVRKVTCGDCRRVLGRSFVGLVSSMSEAQLLTLQRVIGIDGPALRTPAAWRTHPMPSFKTK